MREEPIIKIEKLGKTFSGKSGSVTVLDDINIEIIEGEIFGIIGMSGAGKSTLVRCINFLEKPTCGKIIFGGVDLSSLNRKQLSKIRRSMGMIFQQFNLLMQSTALKNVCFPLEISGVSPQKAKARAMELLNIVGLEEKYNAYPSQLSGGQKQRVAIARALATNPKVLLCDEATSALDPTTTRSILTLLKDINSRLGITIVIITHEMKVIEEICRRVAIIDSSHIAEIGTVEEVYARPKSAVAKRLFFPDGQDKKAFVGKKLLRIVFDGRSSYEPIIADLIIDCGEKINIMYANTKNIDGNAVGQMIIQLPEDTKGAERIKNYLEGKDVIIKEVGEDELNVE